MTEVFIVDATRTPFGRYAGVLSGIRADDLAALPIRALMARHPTLDWAELDEVILGCANQAGEDNRNLARMALLLAGLPVTVPGVTVNRLCASGLEAVAQGARMIASGDAAMVLVGGAESMSRAPYVMAKAAHALARDQKLEDTTLGWRVVNPVMRALHGVDSMVETAENLARELGIDRQAQDRFALRSQQRAAIAQDGGWLAEEISPVLAGTVAKPALVSVDEHPRPGTTLDALGALEPIVGPAGSVTAGNASGLNDGACALLLASEADVARHGLQPIARILGCASAGVPPRTMGLGPVPAIRKLLLRLKLELADVARIEINEAFAAQVLACTRALEMADDDERVNPCGGAIALGHPLGASGARLLASASFGLRRDHQRLALVSLCVGVGQGLAMAIEAV